MSSKQIFVWHLSKRIVRMESAGKEAASYRKSRAVVGWKKPMKPRKDAFSLVFFQPITARLFPIKGRPFSCALHSNDSSWQASDEKLLRRHEYFNQSNYFPKHENVSADWGSRLCGLAPFCHCILILGFELGDHKICLVLFQDRLEKPPTQRVVIGEQWIIWTPTTVVACVIKGARSLHGAKMAHFLVLQHIARVLWWDFGCTMFSTSRENQSIRSNQPKSPKSLWANPPQIPNLSFRNQSFFVHTLIK